MTEKFTCNEGWNTWTDQIDVLIENGRLIRGVKTVRPGEQLTVYPWGPSRKESGMDRLSKPNARRFAQQFAKGETKLLS